ncbi:hypothetical protein IZU99_01310 [Oscillospiraceae bacterium CM]|nr:hypothetical protein IZU99_01310 [Oscillospiraceae bacterium CM]
MKQLTENKSSSAAALITITAVALIGFSVVAIGNGSLESYLHKRKLRNKDRIAAIDSQIEAILAENESLRQNMGLMSESLDKMLIQNEKLLTSNKNMALALKEEHERVLELMNVITTENEEKLILTRRLEEANNKLTEYAAILSEKTEMPKDASAKEIA